MMSFGLMAFVNALGFACAAGALILPERRRPSVVLLIGALALAFIGLNVYPYLSRWKETSQAAYVPGKTVEEATRQSPEDADIYHNFRRRFHDQVYGIEANATRWLGIKTLQNPNDAWIHQEIIAEVKPDLIIETGTHRGGSALLWAMVLQQVNPNGKVATVDIEDLCQEARNFPLWKEKIEFFKGSSTDPAIVEEMAKRAKGGKVLVILDSAHFKAHVLREMQLYAPLVSVGSYLSVQDTFYDYPPAFHEKEGPGPWTAVQEFLAGNDRFVIDPSRERLLLTFNPRGHLKRVK